MGDNKVTQGDRRSWCLIAGCISYSLNVKEGIPCSPRRLSSTVLSDKTLFPVIVGHMEKQEMEMIWKLEMETGNGNQKLKTEMETQLLPAVVLARFNCCLLC